MQKMIFGNESVETLYKKKKKNIEPKIFENVIVIHRKLIDDCDRN